MSYLGLNACSCFSCQLVSEEVHLRDSCLRLLLLLLQLLPHQLQLVVQGEGGRGGTGPPTRGGAAGVTSWGRERIPRGFGFVGAGLKGEGKVSLLEDSIVSRFNYTIFYNFFYNFLQFFLQFFKKFLQFFYVHSC